MVRARCPALTAAVVALVATPGAGCLSAPTGRAPGDHDAATDAGGDGPDPDGPPTDGAGNAWPVAGVTTIAIGSGDLDGDALADLVVLDGAGGRIYLLRGGTDLSPTRATATTFSDSVALTGLRAPAAATISENAGVRRVLVVDSPTGGVRLTVFSAALDQTGTAMLTSGAPNLTDTVSVTPSTFGMSGSSVFLNNATVAGLVEGNRLGEATPPIVPVQETGTAFQALQRITGYLPGPPPALPRMVAAEPERIQRASVDMGSFTWTDVRPLTAGDPWTSMRFAEVTGDAFPDVVGFAPKATNPADICVADTHNATLPTCYDTPFGMDEGDLQVGPVMGATQDDVILLHQPPQVGNDPALFVVRNVRVTGAQVMADATTAPIPVTGLVGPARHALVQLDTGAVEIAVVGADGATACMKASGTNLVACGP